MLLSVLSVASCNNDDDNNQILPPATQTGAGTFACTVNGQNFIDTSGGFFNCFYQLVDGEYYFNIQGQAEIGMITSINLGTTKKEITEDETLFLIENSNNSTWAGARFLLNVNSSEFSNTNQINTGELAITKLDFENNIVSGTFWFDLENPYTGELVQIREGRFDTLFTQ
jgi:hypothetical protein